MTGESGPAAVAVPGRVTGADVEGQADALDDAAARLAELLAAFTQEPRRSLDAIAVFRGLSRTAEAMAAAAAELRRQEWLDFDDEADPEASAAWTGALAGCPVSCYSPVEGCPPRRRRDVPGVSAGPLSWRARASSARAASRSRSARSARPRSSVRDSSRT